MTQEELRAIRERADAATPGPWHAAQHWPEMIYDAAGELVAEAGTHGLDSERREADAAFIAHARTDIPALLDYIARLRERGHNLLAAIESAHEQGELSKAAMLRLNTPGAMMRRTIRRDTPPRVGEE